MTSATHVPPRLLEQLEATDRADIDGLAPVAALDLLHERDRREPSGPREVVMRNLRILAGQQRRSSTLTHEKGLPAISDEPVELRHTVDDVPYVEAGQLTLAALSQALRTRGCLLVKNMISRERAAEMREAIDRTLDAMGDQEHPRDEVLSTPPRIEGQPVNPMGRVWTRREGGSLTVDSPWILEEVLDDYRRGGVVAVAEEFVKERPALAAEKCYVRRFPADGLFDNGWHQDGSFIGTPRVLNGWLTFTDCGRDAPGMELFIRPVDEIYTSDGQADFAWSLTDEQVRALASDPSEIVIPEFEAGDCLLFDHLLVHRTSRLPTSVNTRHSAETWFFAPSTMKPEYVPVLV